jgi:tetratricopeptide (TPR) repeat protein
MAEASGDAGEFGARLRAWRFSVGLSQGQLADLCGLSERAIRNLERGRARSPHPDSVRRLADALDLSGPARAEFIAAARQHRLPQAAYATAGERLAGKGGPVGVGGAVPRQLPPAVPAFTGRSSELAALTDALTRPGRTVVITAIGGTAGVGKTALAVHWAHQVSERFPDGQLYVNLRGFDPGQPVPAEDALAGFLRSLGVPGQEIPSDREERAARYRSLVAGRRMLIVVDNAGSADQVRPLLPGTESCAVVVTSRDALAGLVARDGAGRLDLDVLSLPEAVALLRALIGDGVDADPAAAAVLAGQCCRLPLALRVAAELAVSRAAIPLAALTGELTDLRTRLDLLGAGGDPGTEARTVFSWSCRYLDAGTARVFGLLGWHPGLGFDSWAAAALAGVTADEAGGALGLLARAHLVQPVSPGRYGMHDLLRSYACELAGGREPQAALTRLLDYYLYTAAAAMDVLFPAERHRRPRIPEPAAPVPALPDAAAARDWLDSELGALVAAARHAAECGWPGHAIRLALTLDRYLRIGGHFPEALTVFGHAMDAARHAGDRAAEAAALCRIGQVDAELGRPQLAADRYRQALGLCRVAGDQAGEALVLSNLGIAEVGLNRYEEAARRQQEAVAIYRDIGEQFGQARALGNLGIARERQGRYQEAAGYQRQALELAREAGDPQGEAFALARLGVVDLRLGRYPEAARYFEQAMAQFAAIGDTASVCEVLVKLGDVYAGLGRHEQAADSFERVAALSREIGHTAQEADALNCLGDLLLRKGEHGQASARYFAAVLLASQAGAAAEQARAQDGLARIRLAAAHVSDHDGHGPPMGEAPG